MLAIIELLSMRSLQEKSPWAELDREATSTSRQRAGLGSDDWYGGTVNFPLKFKRAPKDHLAKGDQDIIAELGQPEKGPTCWA
jgi:hypothetical protein